MKKPIIDISECVLCDICVELCPDVFIKNTAGYVEVAENFDEHINQIRDKDKKEEQIKRLEDDINEVIKNCRGDCISWGEET